MDAIKNTLIGFAIFSFVIVGGISIMGDFFSVDSSLSSSNQYDRFTETFNSTFENVESNTAGVKNSITDAETSGVLGVLFSLINAAWSAIKSIFTSFNFMFTAFTGLTTIFGIPAFIPATIVTVITLVFIFTMIKAIFMRS